MDIRQFDLLVELCGDARNLCTCRSSGIEADACALARLATRHKTASLFLSASSALPVPVSGEVRDLLKGQVGIDAILRAALVDEWLEISEAMQDAGIQCLTLKGPAIALQLYGDPMAREFTDLDIMVEHGDISRAVALMRNRGYGPGLALSHHIVFRKGKVRVELHDNPWKLHEDFFPIPASDLFIRSIPLEWRGKTARAPSFVDHSLYVLSHGFHHGWALLHWILDAASIFGSSDRAFLDELAERVRSSRMERQAILALEICRKLFPFPVPAAFDEIDKRWAGKVVPMVDRCVEHLPEGGLPDSSIAGILGRAFFYYAGFAPRLRSAWKPIAVLLRPSENDRSDIHLPPSLGFLLVALHPFLVIRRRLSRLMSKRGAL